jgi:hypothetical protein
VKSGVTMAQCRCWSFLRCTCLKDVLCTRHQPSDSRIGYDGPDGTRASYHVIYIWTSPDTQAVVDVSFCGVSVKQLSKTGSGQSGPQPCQRADSEVQVQLEVVCTADACRCETRKNTLETPSIACLAKVEGLMPMMYVCGFVVGLGDRCGQVRQKGKLSTSHGLARCLRYRSLKELLHVVAS